MMMPFCRAHSEFTRLIVFFAALVFLLPSELMALELWPQAELRLLAADKGFDRGLLIADEPGYGAAVTLGLEPVEVNLAWMRYSQLWANENVCELYSYALRYLAADTPVIVSCGFAGDMFDSVIYPEFDDRHEVFLSIRRELSSLPGVSLECNVSADIQNDMAMYANLACHGTVVLSKSIDLDYQIEGGLGDSRFAQEHTAHLGFEGPDSWTDASAGLSLPVMLGSVDLVPSVSYEWVLDGDARKLLQTAGVPAESWQVGLSIVIYLQ